MTMIDSLVLLIFPLLDQTLCFLVPLYFCIIVSSKGGWKLPPFLCSLIENPNILLAHPFKEKTQWKILYMKQQM